MAIELRGVSYRYPGTSRLVLVDVDLAIAPGEVVGVAGANESGKSTLCLIASGLAPGVVGGKLQGSVAIDGAETATLKPFELAQRCGILFQNSVTQLSGTSRNVWEEIAFGPRNLGLPVSEVVERVEESMTALRIGELAARDPQRLSGGQAQLVALAAVLALRPAYLVLDEPTSQLDPQGTLLVGDALAAIAAEAGTGILLVEHKSDLLARMAGRVVVLDAGRLVLQGAAAQVLADPALAHLGVRPPSAVELATAARAAGVKLDPAVLAEAR
ncbi:MAG: energy-coupling factor transport system ATP-binding protein [Chloroflexota bacterium]|nr:energy-coupling factor transport system ATP-binding protein [Chloroflexota bacterium]